MARKRRIALRMLAFPVAFWIARATCALLPTLTWIAWRVVPVSGPAFAEELRVKIDEKHVDNRKRGITYTVTKREAGRNHCRSMIDCVLLWSWLASCDVALDVVSVYILCAAALLVFSVPCARLHGGRRSAL